jgi:hypothetical protein
MKLGFSGTRHGMTVLQRRDFIELVQAFQPMEFHHGDCLGADDEANLIIMELLPNCKRISHPPINATMRAFSLSDEILPEKDYLPRNLDICTASDVVIACPKEFQRQFRGGTWHVIRHCTLMKKPLHILYPHGVIEHRNTGN